MPNFCVDDEARNGDFLVHRSHCIYVKPLAIDLGDFQVISQAVEEAERLQQTVGRCGVCCPEPYQGKVRKTPLQKLEGRLRSNVEERRKSVAALIDADAIADRVCELAAELESSRRRINPLREGLDLDPKPKAAFRSTKYPLRGPADALELAIRSIGYTLSHLKYDEQLAKELVLRAVARRQRKFRDIVRKLWSHRATASETE